jgi:hypothetical protein
MPSGTCASASNQPSSVRRIGSDAPPSIAKETVSCAGAQSRNKTEPSACRLIPKLQAGSIPFVISTISQYQKSNNQGQKTRDAIPFKNGQRIPARFVPDSRVNSRSCGKSPPRGGASVAIRKNY